MVHALAARGRFGQKGVRVDRPAEEPCRGATPSRCNFAAKGELGRLGIRWFMIAVGGMMTGRALQNRLPSALFLVLAGITLGAISTYLYLSHARTTWDSEWHDLVLTREGFGYTTEALVFS